MGIDFEDRVVLVTGATKGLGLSFARCLAEAGAHVVLNSRTPYPGHSLEFMKNEGLKVSFIKGPVEESQELIDRVMDQNGRLDSLVHNAGFIMDKTLKKMSDSQWSDVMGVHLTSAFKLTRAAWPHFEEAGGGRIVFLSSATGLYGNFGQANYASAKLGMLGLAKTIAIEGAKSDITCNCVAPFGATGMNSANFPDDLKKAIKAEYVAPLVAYLVHKNCSESGSMFEASAGSFKKVRWERSRGLNLDPRQEEITIDKIAKSWEEIVSFSDSEHPDSMGEALKVMYERLLDNA
ncbi:MAG: serine/threonine protein kinase [Gammaproteobacteria bacterium]|nr:serine/threonine protein kinase [Gammaproteobacteria bacterium]|tara:strand:- start:68 stop:943 length:876 start_codon:yes stop_codon:yes gene_type:complete